ncbi:MAG TPA: hypothetical protein DCX32_01200 [Candidatus Moranbacteria bacterium]|nr:MAG: type II secretion system F domain protein, type IV pilus assembly protein PilC [Parcubacteria group bacterium GW2011_GWC1_45_14]HAV11145.1 hypothetical protein [Candidatus Moranbacteria bacterium]
MKFNFQAKNSEGEVREGRIESLNRDEAIAVLQEKGLIPLVLEKEDESMNVLRNLERLWNSVDQQELAVFYRQFATLVEAKVSITTALRAIEEQTENKLLGSVLIEMIGDVEDGMPLSESMMRHKDVFSPLAINMIKAGEISGNLQKSIIFIADNTERAYQLNSKVKSALMYPGFILSASVIIGFVVFTVILPKLTKIFDDMAVAIPWYTQLIMDTGNFMQSFWWAVLIIVLGGVVGVLYYIKTDSGKDEFDQIKIKLPIIKKMFKFVYIARFSENLSVLLNGGIPIVKALMIVGDIVDNSVYRKIILRAAEEVKTGGVMSSVFAKYEEFPPILAKMIKVGEETGKISDVLKNISSFYEQEIDRMTKNMTALIEPILIVVLGLGVALLVFAILMPIYSITGQIQ